MEICKCNGTYEVSKAPSENKLKTSPAASENMDIFFSE